MKFKCKSIALIATMFTVGCGVFSSKDNNNGSSSNDDEFAKGRGCIQGVVVDGISGERVGLNSNNDAGTEQGVFVLVRNKMLLAQTQVKDPKVENANKNLFGEYNLCNIPLDEEFPIFVWQEGYLAFEGVVSVDSTISQRTPNSEVVDIPLEYPTTITDMQIYPLGTQAQDLQFNLFSQGGPLQGAQVQLKPTGANFLDDSRILTRQLRIAPMTAISDKNGHVLFEGSKLVLGGIYKYTIIPAAGASSARVLSDNITVGLRKNGATLTDRPYEVNISLDNTTKKPELVASSLEVSEVNANGEITLWFDQEVELAPASAEGLSASLTGAEKAVLADVQGNEFIKSIEGKKIVLKPVWKTVPNNADDEFATITFSNVIVRPKNDTRASTRYLTLQPITVRLYDKK